MEKPKKQRRIIHVRYDNAYKKLEKQMDKHLSRLNGLSAGSLMRQLAQAKQ